VVLTALVFFFVNGVTSRFAMVGASPFLFSLGFPEASLAPLITLGQLVEVATMAMLSWLVRRLGYRRTVLAGIAAEVARHLLFLGALVVPGGWFLLPALGVHGFIFTTFNTGGTMAVDEGLTVDNRAGVHQALNVAFLGFGGFVGSLLAGFFLDAGLTAARGWLSYWSVPAAMAGALYTFALFRKGVFRVATSGS
jgi:MFS family permease